MISSIRNFLPELDQFIRQLARECTTHNLDREMFLQKCNAFYDDAMMQKIDSVTIGWIDMASHQNGATLYHVTSVLVALQLLPEYQSGSIRQRAMMEWAVLFHDIAKVPVKNGHDYVHGFKSSAIAGKGLIKLGFPLNDGQSEKQLHDWYDLTYTAIIHDAEQAETIQDNGKLAKIIEGLRKLHSNDAYCIVTAILFHLSIKTDPDYPILAPITKSQIVDYITQDSLPIIKAMLLVDNDGWCLFDADRTIQQRRRKQTLTVFEQFVTPLVLST